MQLNRRQSVMLATTMLLIFFALSISLIDHGSVPIDFSLPPEDLNLSESGNQEELLAKLDGDQKGSAIRLNKFQRSETRDGKKLWEVTAASGQYLPDQQSALIEKATLFFFQEDGKIIELEADQARLTVENANLSQAEIEGSVKVTFNKDISLITDKALYDRTNNSVTAPGAVTINSDLIEITGELLQADLDKQEFVLRTNVSSVIKPQM